MADWKELKTDPVVFSEVWCDKKLFEIRLNDRNYQVGDVLNLRETVYSGHEMLNEDMPLIYTGRTILCTVTSILNGPIYGIKKDWCVMSIQVTDKQVLRF